MAPDSTWTTESRTRGMALSSSGVGVGEGVAVAVGVGVGLGVGLAVGVGVGGLGVEVGGRGVGVGVTLPEQQHLCHRLEHPSLPIFVSPPPHLNQRHLPEEYPLARHSEEQDPEGGGEVGVGRQGEEVGVGVGLRCRGVGVGAFGSHQHAYMLYGPTQCDLEPHPQSLEQLQQFSVR